MERLFLSFHPRETLPRPGEILFMDGMAGRYRIRVERVGRAISGNGRVHLPIWGTRTLVFAQKPRSSEKM
jgi:hypothetical protein